MVAASSFFLVKSRSVAQAAVLARPDFSRVEESWAAAALRQRSSCRNACQMAAGAAGDAQP